MDWITLAACALGVAVLIAAAVVGLWAYVAFTIARQVRNMTETRVNVTAPSRRPDLRIVRD